MSFTPSSDPRPGRYLADSSVREIHRSGQASSSMAIARCSTWSQAWACHASPRASTPRSPGGERTRAPATSGTGGDGAPRLLSAPHVAGLSVCPTLRGVLFGYARAGTELDRQVAAVHGAGVASTKIYADLGPARRERPRRDHLFGRGRRGRRDRGGDTGTAGPRTRQALAMLAFVEDPDVVYVPEREDVRRRRARVEERLQARQMRLDGVPVLVRVGSVPGTYLAAALTISRATGINLRTLAGYFRRHSIPVPVPAGPQSGLRRASTTQARRNNTSWPSATAKRTPRLRRRSRSRWRPKPAQALVLLLAHVLVVRHARGVDALPPALRADQVPRRRPAVAGCRCSRQYENSVACPRAQVIS
jgi:hypothetical protein